MISVMFFLNVCSTTMLLKAPMRNIKLIFLIFGVEKGNEVLHSVRPAEQPLVDSWDCLKSYIFEVQCGRLTAYGRKHVRGIANICNAGITSEKMAAMSTQACSKKDCLEADILHFDFVWVFLVGNDEAFSSYYMHK
ncbi:hypothetical protein H5410_041887 [Solanum commersonii]|uniref:Legumain prodomain domain-containing protein n=1 Tax=Solanum commersonii TaxID=4109 RepID=A0A9J5XU62_SOLCO|nr:hypothetical protein H5410_041887 [Solanum commersonii]